MVSNAVIRISMSVKRVYKDVVYISRSAIRVIMLLLESVGMFKVSVRLLW